MDNDRSADGRPVRSRPARRPCAALLRGAGALILALAVADCAGTDVAGRRGGDNKYGVSPSPKVVADGDPIPKGGGRAMVGKPYVVGGRTYVPGGGKGFDREGWASWYGTAFHGRLTANGEVFDRQSVAAASPTLPLPSYVRVTNVANKRSLIVRVNDRGPFERNRLIDVSERAAEALDFRRKGTARVRVEYLGKASVHGSDDEMLLATLRTDGSRAPLERTRGPVMLADLTEGSAPRPLAFKTASSGPVPVAPAPAMEAIETVASRTVVETLAPGRPEPEDAVPAVAMPTSVALAEAVPAEAIAAIDETGEDGPPLPPRRPVDLGGRPIPVPLAIVELLPPQRPALANLY